MIAAGVAKVEAYGKLYPKASRRTARDKGSKLAQRPEVEERIVELLEAGAEEAIWCLAEMLEYLRAVAVTPHTEVNEKSAICRGMRRTAKGAVYKMPDKLRAVELYGKLAGDMDPKVGPERNVMGELMNAIRAGTWGKRRDESGAGDGKSRSGGEEKSRRVLGNARHERFAQLVGSGERAGYAYEKVYGVRRATAAVEGYRLSHQPLVAERIRKIRQAGSAEAGWTRRMRMRYLRELAEKPIGEIDEGSCYCQGVRRSRDGEEIVVPDKLKAVAMYFKLAKVQQTRKAETIEEIAAGMRSRGRVAMADGVERSLINFVGEGRGRG